MSKHFYPWTPPQPIPTSDPSARIIELVMKALLKEEKKRKQKADAPKPPDKKSTFTFAQWMQISAICLLMGIPVGMMEILLVKGIGNAFLQALRLQ